MPETTDHFKDPGNLHPHRFAKITDLKLFLLGLKRDTRMKPLGASGGFPTLLLVELHQEHPTALSDCLRSEGYHVLEARDWSEALDIIKIHSRPIQVLLTGMDKCSVEMSGTAKLYRPEMQVLLVSQHPLENHPNVQDPDSVLRMLRGFLKPGKHS